ncbi:MAG: hypothetical protein CL840_05255 [Crocinitomicaceae bacterium]|nr:hypothetical protein [Crocinitomicaceae bacterium]
MLHIAANSFLSGGEYNTESQSRRLNSLSNLETSPNPSIRISFTSDVTILSLRLVFVLPFHFPIWNIYQNNKKQASRIIYKLTRENIKHNIFVVTEFYCC